MQGVGRGGGASEIHRVVRHGAEDSTAPPLIIFAKPGTLLSWKIDTGPLHHSGIGFGVNRAVSLRALRLKCQAHCR
jgi:hypothetical protein